jgi:hypothetical protein
MITAAEREQTASKKISGLQKKIRRLTGQHGRQRKGRGSLSLSSWIE